MARVTSVVGRSRSSTSVFTEVSISPQEPRSCWNRDRSRVRPSLPTFCPRRFSSRAICSLAATISLKVSATFPSMPVHVLGSRAVKSPSRMRRSVASNTAASKPPSFCLGDVPFSTTETGIFESVVEGRRALVFNLGLAKGFNCLSAQSESRTHLVPSALDESDQLATPSGNSREEIDSALQPDGPPSASPYKQ